MSENTKRDTDSEYQQNIKHADPFNSELDPMIVFGSDRSSRSHFVRLSVRPSVRPFGDKLSRAVNLHHSGSNLQAISQQSVSSQLAVS